MVRVSYKITTDVVNPDALIKALKPFLNVNVKLVETVKLSETEVELTFDVNPVPDSLLVKKLMTIARRKLTERGLLFARELATLEVVKQ
jgi:hypothetical protein